MMGSPSAHPMYKRLRTRLRRWASGPSVAWAVLLGGIALTALAGWRLHIHSTQRREARFEADVSRLHQSLVRYLEAEVELLRGAQGLFDAAPVDPRAWRAFVSRFDLRHRYPGIRSIGFLQRVAASDLRAFEAEWSRELGMAITVEPPEAGWGFYPRFMEPTVRDRRNDLTWNLFREPRRRDTLRRAIALDAPTASPSLELVGLDDPRERPHPAVVIYLPVFRGGGTPPPEQRWEACRGVVFISLMFHQVLEPLSRSYPDLCLRLTDLDEGGRELFRTPSRSWELPEDQARTFEQSIAQRRWAFHYREAAPSRSFPGSPEASGFLVVGLLASLGAAAMVRALALGKRDAQRLASDLRGSEARFRRLTEQAPCGILLLEQDRVAYANPFAEMCLRHRRGGLAGRAWPELLHPDERVASVLLETLLRTEDSGIDDEGEGSHRRLETRLVGPDGGFLWADLTLGRLGRGRVLATFFDITTRVEDEARRLEMERKLSEARRLEGLGALAGGLAHDFNNLLGIILGHADLRGGEGQEAIQRACLRAAELTRQMLAFAGGEPFDLKDVDLGALVGSQLQEARRHLPAGVLAEVDAPSGVGPVPGHPEALRQVVEELWENALEALEGRGGHIRVSVAPRRLAEADLGAFRDADGLPAGDYACLTVEDDGRGMDAEHLTRIFEPFFSTKFLGRGMGLAAAAGLVKGHRGALRAESRPGLGTRFEVVLPLKPDWTDVTGHGRSAHGVQRGRVVLVVDDEPAIREIAVAALGMVGLTVLEAPGGRAALQLLEAREDIGLLVLDMAMPDLSGAEVLRAIRGIFPGLRVILSSGYAEESLRTSLEPGDVHAFLPKPYRVSRLQEVAKELLGG